MDLNSRLLAACQTGGGRNPGGGNARQRSGEEGSPARFVRAGVERWCVSWA